MPLEFNAKYIFLGLILMTGNWANGQNNIDQLYKLSAKQFKEGKYDDALITNIKALKIAEKSNNCSQLAFALLQVGIMEYYDQNKRLALEYFFRSLKSLEFCEIDSLEHVIYSDIGGVYTEFNLKDSALFYLLKSEELLETSHNYAGLSKVNAVLADLFMTNFKDLKKGEKYLQNAERYAAMSKNKVWIAFALMKRGIFHQNQKQFPKAMIAFESALKNYEELGLVEGRLYALHMILNILFITRSGEMQTYFYKLTNLKDSVYKAEGAAKIAEFQTIYKTEKKETENKLLQQENKLNQTQIDAKNRTIIGLSIGVLLIVVTAFWRISAINLKKKNRELEAAQAVQKEKERISRDLHDNVGGQLSYVLYALDGMNEENLEKRRELTSNINESIRNVIGNLRETIWAINDESITINDFSDKLKVYARNMFRNTNTQINFSENINHNMHLNAVTGLNLYRICQEIINNAFKHSGAGELKVEISVIGKTSIIISDNGKGFNQEQKFDSGFGLSNMKVRASEAGIQMELSTGINKGTTYFLVV